MAIKISGINGSANILSSSAKIRVENGTIDHCVLKVVDGGYVVTFALGDREVEWEGEPLVLCSARNPYEPRVFKSIDGAWAESQRIGIKNLTIR